jgi:hypothetical protein
MIIPDGHDENHSFLQRCSHSGETSLGLELIGVTKGSLLGIAERVRDGVTRNSSDGGLRVGDDNAVLNIEASDFGQGAGRSAIIGDELGDDRELGAGVDSQSLSIECGITHAVRVEIASISITKGGISSVDSAVCSSATSLLADRARMAKIQQSQLQVRG